MIKLTKIILLAAIAAAGAVPAFANTVLTSYTGQVQLPSLPGSLVVHTFESDTAVSLFLESSRTVLQTPLGADATGAGTYASNAQLNPGFIAAGTTVSSTLLHSDPVGATHGEYYAGSVVFSGNIIGIIALSATLDQSDATLGAPGVTYTENNAWRGLELTALKDSFTISADLHTFTFHLATGGVEDEIRILTADALNSQPSGAAALPEPGTTSFLALGFAGLCAGKFVSKAKSGRRR